MRNIEKAMYNQQHLQNKTNLLYTIYYLYNYYVMLKTKIPNQTIEYTHPFRYSELSFDSIWSNHSIAMQQIPMIATSVF